MRRLTIILLVMAQTLVSAAAANAYFSGALTPGNPLAGHRWYVDIERSSWWVAMRADPSAAGAMAAAAFNPMGKTFAAFNADPAVAVRDYILRAEKAQPGSIPFLNLARMESPSCPYRSRYPGGFSEKQIDNWVRGFSRGVGGYRVMVILETDKLTGTRCLPRWAQARRFREFRYEVHTLRVHNPKSIVYIDAGAADWGKTPGTIAGWLRRADVAEAQGFALNASHHDWTYKEVRYGLKVSKRLHNEHFVVNTNSNGWGPKPHGVTSVTPFYHGGCTPPGEGLGFAPTVKTSDPRVDAYVWSGTPGFESGDCLGLGAHAPYTFYLQEAVSLSEFANPKP
ncbi:MAG: glycoside hydrolase family 6 protein [Actinomycetota bacterium]|nr:glycoside hydrolase family 6 protein [Actinomycetota bacterium]